MSAHVLLNLLNELRKQDKMRGLPSIYISFFASLINSIIQEHECRDSIYHKTLKLHKKHIFGVKTSRFCYLLCNVIMDIIM